MADSASEVELESDTSSVDGVSIRDAPAKYEQLQRRFDLLQQENKVLKTEVETLKLKVRSLTDSNQQLRKNSVTIQAKAEQEEEYISNMLQRRISELKKEKESLAVNYEQEEECLTNELNRKLMQLQKEKELLERTLAKEQETQVNKLKRRIEKLESEKNSKQQSLDQLRREKIELENALEQEQEALVNRLWKKMDKLEAEKRLLQEKLESVSAPLSGSSSVQNLSGSGSNPHHAASICMGTFGASNLRASLRMAGAPPQQLTTPQHQPQQSHPQSEIRQTSFDGLKLGRCGSQSDGNSPCNLQHEGSQEGTPSSSCGRLPSASFSPLRPPQSPMDTDATDGTQRNPPDLSMSSSFLSKSDHSLPSRASCGPLPRGPIPPAYLDSVTGAAYVARLRDEVYRLRAIVVSNQSEHVARMGAYEREERVAADENMRLKRLLQAEFDKKEALSRQFSGSESSLEMEDERQFNEASRGMGPSRFRTTSDGCPSPCHPNASPLFVGPCVSGGSLYGPGYAYAHAMVATNSRSVSPRYCRECGQAVNRNGAGAPITSPRGRPPSYTPPHSPASPTTVANGGRFIKPRPLSFTTAVFRTSGDKVSTPSQHHPFVATKDDDEEEDEEDDRCRTPPSVAP